MLDCILTHLASATPAGAYIVTLLLAASYWLLVGSSTGLPRCAIAKAHAIGD